MGLAVVDGPGWWRWEGCGMAVEGAGAVAPEDAWPTPCWMMGKKVCLGDLTNFGAAAAARRAFYQSISHPNFAPRISIFETGAYL